MIRGITFDFGGTLAEGELDVTVYRERLQDYLSTLGLKKKGSPLRIAMSDMLARLGKVRERNLELRFEELYSHVLHRLRIPASEEILSHVYELYLRSFSSVVIPGVDRILESLYRSYRLAVISNAASNLPRYVLRESGLAGFFRVIVISRDIGLRKPDPRIFKYTLEKLGVDPEEALHVGDSMEHDVVGAKRARMGAVWIKRGGVEVIEEPDYLISSINELSRILDR